MTLKILRSMSVVQKRATIGRAYCETCTRTAEFFVLRHIPDDPARYDGPDWTIECEHGHVKRSHRDVEGSDRGDTGGNAERQD